MKVTNISSRADLSALITEMKQSGHGYSVPILQAFEAGSIAYVDMQQDTSATYLKRWMASISLPSLLMIGDDAHRVESGPDHWPLAERALRWCRGLIVNGARGDLASYHAAVKFTHRHQRVVMIECASTDIIAWHKAADRWSKAVRHIIVPEPGVIHPAKPGRGDIH